MRLPLSLTLIALSQVASADVLKLQPVRDVTLYETLDGAFANGVGEYMFAGATAAGDARRCLFTFAIGEHVPKGSTVNSVTLELFMSKTVAGPHDFALHRATANWGEGLSDAPLEEGGGTVSEVDDATWIHTFYATQFWAAPGGDFDPVASGVFSIDVVGKYFMTSPGLLVDVQAWADGTQEDFGWLMKVVDESIDTTAKRFGTKDGSLDFFKPLLVIDFTPAEIGSGYCSPAVVNSTGAAGHIRAIGSDLVADESVILQASSLPTNQFGYFLNSQMQGFITNPGGSQGNLCLSGAIGRYASFVANTGGAGSLQLKLDLLDTPTPSGSVAIMPGETWNFTCWFRDVNPGATSNFTDGVSVVFL